MFHQLSSIFVHNYAKNTIKTNLTTEHSITQTNMQYKKITGKHVATYLMDINHKLHVRFNQNR